MSRAVAGRLVGLGLAAALAPATAHAGGLARPNIISARGVGMGGAFVPIADDPTAMHFNPAGAAFAPDAVHLGAELVIAPRSYTPIDADGVRGEAQEPETPVVPLPALGVLARITDRVTFGGGVWNTYGGQLSYMPTGRPAIDASREAVVELAAGLAYRVNDRLSLGATFRVGVGLFEVKATDRPITSDLSGLGLGVGTTLGAMWRAHPRLTVAGAWRSGLVVDIAGDGVLELPGEHKQVAVAHEQAWPQAASIGVAVVASDRVRVATQVDWTQWSRWETLSVVFPGNEAGNQTFPLDWHDSYAVRAGVDVAVSPTVTLRAGAYVDTSAVPDRTIERQYLDANKFGGSLGAGIEIARWRVDVAVDVAGGPARTVPDNSDEVGAFSGRANLAPGEHEGQVLSFELALTRRL